MLTILLWFWQDPACTSVRYDASHVNRAARMIHQNLTLPHHIVVLTDLPRDRWCDFIPVIQPMPLWKDYGDLISPGVQAGKPNCYVRLRAFSEDMYAILGERFVSVDLDCVVTGNLDALFSRPEDFITCRRAPMDRQERGVYQTSMFMLKTGSRPQVWADFYGEESLNALAGIENSRDYLLADQGWILYKLGPHEATWTMQDGVYDWRWLVQEHLDKDLPDNARIVFFPGKDKPWTFEQAPAWVREAD